MAGSKYFKARIKREFAPYVSEMIEDTSQKVMQRVGEKIRDRAKENVKPNATSGMHPGPHPHLTQHDDSGDLMDAIKYRVQKQGPKYAKQWILTVGVLDDEDAARYGMALEIGYKLRRQIYDRYGNSQGEQEFVYQYPWLWPAIQDTQDEIEDTIKTEFDVFFKGTLSSGKKGYIYIGPGDIEGSETPV